MGFLFNDFSSWKKYCEEKNLNLHEVVLEYEVEQKGKAPDEIWGSIAAAYQVMKEAIQTGLNDDMTSRSGMVNNGAKKFIKISSPSCRLNFKS